MAADKPYFNIYDDPKETLRSWQRLLNHIIPRLNTTTAYITVTTATNSTNATNVADGVDSTNKPANLLKKYVVSVTATGAITATNVGKVHVCNVSGNIDLTLPAGATGLWYSVQNPTAHTVTMKCNGAQNINGSATLAMAQYDAATFVWSGTEWLILSGHSL